LQLHIIICYVMLRSEQLLPTLMKKNRKLSSVKLIRKRIGFADWQQTDFLFRGQRSRCCAHNE